MKLNSEEVLTAALDLPDDDRLEIAEALFASLHSVDRPPFDESWRPVIERRSSELKSGQVTTIPWDEVKRQAREKAGG